MKALNMTPNLLLLLTNISISVDYSGVFYNFVCL